MIIAAKVTIMPDHRATGRESGSSPLSGVQASPCRMTSFPKGQLDIYGAPGLYLPVKIRFLYIIGEYAA
jgi:hypothetical protein